ncbi:MAG TPA: L,D-transpeptidase family protein [Sphingomicrobium sp.]|jgi:lipoprotein-anchoring transpeptidase ErfK/SrfK|nr:L,D-transpeptidase family protein [Sphingomicrobium sp.]
MTIRGFAIAVSALALAGCSMIPQPGPRTPVAAAPRPAQELPYRWTQGAAPQAHKDMVATFHRVGLKPGQYLWASAIPSEGDTRIVIDRLTQMAYVYRGDALVGAATVSTASTGRITPLGFWSVLEKRRFYRSKKYDNAPMPFMQRIDEYGIAMHGGNNPGYPASHGCIRLPMKFAEKLYGLTKVGSKVVIEG